MRLPYRPGPDYFDEAYYGKVGEDPLQLGQRAAWLAKTFRPARALEIGAGRGALLKLMRGQGIDAVGVDISRYAAGVHGRGHQLVADDMCLPFRDRAFDLVYGFDIMEHNMEAYVDQIIVECARVCTGSAFFNIALEGTTDDVVDPTHFTLKPRGWWAEKFHPAFEVVGDGGDCAGLSLRSCQFVLRPRN